MKAEKSKTDVRRLVPIKPNLAAWLKDYKRKDGPVCPFKNVVNELMDLIAAINKALPKGTPEKEKMVWKKNGLRHSYISYRVAECADVARVADESGNSPAIIKANYLRRVKPDAAADWFAIRPSPKRSQKVVSLAAAIRRKAKSHSAGQARVGSRHRIALQRGTKLRRASKLTSKRSPTGEHSARP